TRENGLTGVTADHVAICAGAKHALYTVCQCLLEPGHEVLLPVPAWVSYAPIAQLAGASVVELPTTPASGFKITPDQLRGAVTPRSRVLFMNSPATRAASCTRPTSFGPSPPPSRTPPAPPRPGWSSSPTRSTRRSSTAACPTSRSARSPRSPSAPSPSTACP